jgi:hypothetical protein
VHADPFNLKYVLYLAAFMKPKNEGLSVIILLGETVEQMDQ